MADSKWHCFDGFEQGSPWLSISREMEDRRIGRNTGALNRYNYLKIVSSSEQIIFIYLLISFSSFLTL